MILGEGTCEIMPNKSDLSPQIHDVELYLVEIMEIKKRIKEH